MATKRTTAAAAAAAQRPAAVVPGELPRATSAPVEIAAPARRAGAGGSSSGGGGSSAGTSAGTGGGVVRRESSGSVGSLRSVGSVGSAGGGGSSVGNDGGSRRGSPLASSYGSWFSTGSSGGGSGGGGSGSGGDRRQATATTLTTVPLRLTRPSQVPELQRRHALEEVGTFGPARLLRTCAVCKEAVTWPQTPTYALCLRCLAPVHLACRESGDAGGPCGAVNGQAGAVAVVDIVALALADKVARLDAIDALLTPGSGGGLAGGGTLPRDRRLSMVRDDDTAPLPLERRGELTRERATLLSTSLVASADVSPDTVRVTRMDERPTFLSVAGGLKDRVLSALS